MTCKAAGTWSSLPQAWDFRALPGTQKGLSVGEAASPHTPGPLRPTRPVPLEEPGVGPPQSTRQAFPLQAQRPHLPPRPAQGRAAGTAPRALLDQEALTPRGVSAGQSGPHLRSLGRQQMLQFLRWVAR